MITNEYKGKRCFIVGGGASISYLIEHGLDVSKLICNEITVGTNKSYLLGKSTYHVVMDSSYYSKDKINLLHQNLLVSDSIGRDNTETKLTVIKRSNKSNTSISNTFEEGLYDGKSSGYLAMNVAHVMGCNPIYLLGIDLVGKHFHDGYGAAKDLSLPKEHRVIEREFRKGVECVKSKGVPVVSLSHISVLNDIIPYDTSVLEFYGFKI